MASMHDLIEQIEDARLRERLRQEWEASVREKKFGLVFEPHLPELLPLPKVKPRRGDLVCMREGSLKDLWRVRRVANGVAFCVKPGAEGQGGPVDPVQFSLDELLVVRQFGEPIFPALIPVDQVQNGEAGAPWHTLIEADNFHALQLLDYLYAGKVDCIYIDPPYNTGARDWKYNNDYVDKNDAWRHSKWLAFMEKRLRMAKRLLRPENGVLVVTIDKNELYHLGMLLAEIFPAATRQIITVCINPSGSSGEGFSRVEEYALFCFLGSAEPVSVPDDMLLERSAKKAKHIRWEALMRGGTAWYRKERDNLCYPVVLDPSGTRIVDVGEPMTFHDDEKLDIEEEQRRPLWRGKNPLAWPVRNDGRLGIWRVDGKKLRALAEKGYAYVSSHDSERGTWTIRYIMEGTVKAIDEGKIVVDGRGDRGEVVLTRLEDKRTTAKTMWNRGRHTAGGVGGTFLIAEVLNKRNAFSFPKSIYSTRDALEVAVGDRLDALIVDFFAGSGTTLNAVNLMNAVDNGKRRCLIVTNNEVSAEQADVLRDRGLQAGDAEWEAHGICRSVTWPRSKFTIKGFRDDGTKLPGVYLTGRQVERQKPADLTQVGFVDPTHFCVNPEDADKRKREVLKYQRQLVSLIPNIAASALLEPVPFLLSEDEKNTASVLFDVRAAEDWIDALADADHVKSLFVVTPSKKLFDSLKDVIQERLGPQIFTEEEKRPMSTGFDANLAYFKLDFLDKDRVALKQAFKEVLPMLWLKAGAVGPRPELPRGAAEPQFFDPSGANFAVLLDEGAFRKFVKTIGQRTDLGVVYIVTDADEAFKDMADEVRHALRLASPSVEVVQLYKDYLANFLINTRLDHDLNGQGGQA